MAGAAGGAAAAGSWLWLWLLAGATAAVAAASSPYALDYSADEGEACFTPEGLPGECRLIGDCPSLLSLVTGRPSQQNFYFVNRVRCGFQGSVPVVCCTDRVSAPPAPTTTRRPSPRPTNSRRPPNTRPPNTRPPNTRPPNTRPPNTRPTPRPLVDQVDTSPPDISRHPNLRLLPLDYCSPGGSDRIVGGKVADVFAYPWIARLGYLSKSASWRPVSYKCGGSLINSRYVLTAAHCILTRTDLYLVTVKLGEHTIDTPIDCRPNGGACLPPPIDVDVERTVVHPQYDANRVGSHHDIALVRLARDVDFTREEFVRPVCLPTGRDAQTLRLDSTPLVVAGWGTTETGEASKALKDVNVPVVPQERCREVYKGNDLQREIVPQQLCAGGEASKDSCNGDSGGPLMLEANVGDEIKTVQFGVVSYGPTTCGTAGVPGVYTRISHYMKWILDTMKP